MVKDDLPETLDATQELEGGTRRRRRRRRRSGGDLLALLLLFEGPELLVERSKRLMRG